METFEKWWEEIGQYEFSTYLTKEQSKFIWRAALDWVLKNFDGKTDMLTLGLKIKGELGE